jgi:hypothetical protein
MKPQTNIEKLVKGKTINWNSKNVNHKTYFTFNDEPTYVISDILEKIFNNRAENLEYKQTIRATLKSGK